MKNFYQKYLPLGLSVILVITGVFGYEILHAPQTKAVWGNGFSARQVLTIDHLQVPNTDQANFPVEVNTTQNTLKTVSNGGTVTDTAGLDIIFTSDPTGLSIIPYEKEFYSSTTGQSIYWVKLSNVSHTTDTQFYMFYGKSGASDQSSAANTWNSAYTSVWHLKDGTTLNVNDSTSNGNNGTNNGSATAVAGEIDGGVGLNGTSQSVSRVRYTNTADITMEAWVNPTTWGGGRAYILNNGNKGANGYGLFLSTDGHLHLDVAFVAGIDGGAGSVVATSTWQHVAVTRTAGGTWQLYRNGTAVGGTISNNPNGPGDIFSIGATTNGSITDFLTGSIDEARFSSVQRSADWLATEYNNQKPGANFISFSAESTAPAYTKLRIASSTKATILRGKYSIPGQ